jgi:polyferredoxin
MAIRAGGYTRIDFFYQTTYGLSIGNVQGLLAYFIVLLLLIVLPAYVFGKRSFCHHLCWMAPFMILGRKTRNHFRWAALQLQSFSEKCKHCHTCTENCPMSLPVEVMVNQNHMENAECILCGTCVDGCEQGAILFSFQQKEHNQGH